MIETIHILHTNDIHSHFEYWPQIHRFLQTKRQEFEEKGESVFIFDIGDHVDRSNPFTEGTTGKGNIELLNEAGYDAVTIGNNEGITMSKTALSSLYDEANFDVVVGNIRHENGVMPKWAKASKVYTTSSGSTVGIIGATAYYQQFYNALGWEILPAREQLKVEAEKIKTDLLICLSHLGLPEDRLLAEETNIDVILGAHTHHVLPEGEKVNHSLLAATGKFGDFVGHVMIQLNTETSEIVHQTAKLYRSETLPIISEDNQMIEMKIQQGKKALEEKAFYSAVELKQNLFGHSELASYFGRALIDYTNADCALFNAGIFLSGLQKGWVTKADMHRLLPHPINVCTMELTGAELYDVYYDSLDQELAHIEVKGLGFRGTLMGAILHERLYMNARGALFAGNREVVPHETYTLATLDMFTFGFFFPLFKELKKEYYMPDLIRDVMMKYGQSLDESTTLS